MKPAKGTKRNPKSDSVDKAEISRLAFEASPNAILIVDQKGRIIHLNSQVEKHFGYATSELIGKSIETLIPRRLRRKHQGFRRDYFQEPETRPMGAGRELMALRKDGTEFPVEIGLTSMATGGGIVVMAVVVDITKRKQAEGERIEFEEKIQQTQKLESLGILAGGIAHDFNNLLTGILGNADLALMDLSAVSPARPSIEDIQTCAIRAAELCKQMLAYSGKGRFLVQSLNLSEIIKETTHLLHLSISKSAVINYNLYPNLPLFKGDPTQIRQVIMNLVTNAAEAIGEKSGVITITTGVMECDRRYLSEILHDVELPEGMYVYVEVADTGCGIQPENIKKIFDPFYTTKATGRGLGLAALLGIVRGHKGAAKVYSEPGQGTTIKIIFPSLDAPGRPGKKSSQFADVKEWRGHGKILIIDDEESVRAVACKTLETVGFKPLTAPDGLEGMKVLEKEMDIRLVVLDLTMPHMTGEEVLRVIRRIRPGLPVILISGYNEQELSSRFAGKGLAGFIQKPLRPQVPLTKVREVLSKVKK